MTKTFSIHKTDPVLTADNYQLGQAVRLYHRQNEIDPDEELFPHYLMVANLEIGDEYYVPLHYIVAYDEKTGSQTLNMTMEEISKKQLTNIPSFIAFKEAIDEALPMPPPDRPAPEVKQHVKTTPLPPNW